jgi:hypothetical protein
MKKPALLSKSLLFATFVAITAIANGMGPAPKSSLVTAQKSIREYFRFPAFVSLFPPIAQEKVEVLFTTGLDGRVNFVLAKTPNANLKIEIEKQFMGLPLEQLHSNVVHSVILSFKRI